jgi:hypothetical protein
MQVTETIKTEPKAEPKAKKAAKKAEPKKAAKKAAPKAEPKAKKADKADTFAIHINKTGRVCFGRDAAVRLGEAAYLTITIEGKTIRFSAAKAEGENTVPVRDANGRPYVSCTKQFKPLGFDGSEAIDIEAKPYGNAGFEFRLM